MAAAEDIEEQARNHADAGRAEAPMPAVVFAQRAADEGRQKPADIDADIIDIIGPGGARIARLVEIAVLGRDEVGRGSVTAAVSRDCVVLVDDTLLNTKSLV